MLTKNEIKYIQSLYQKKQRDEEGLFIAEGPKLAQELIDSGIKITHVYAVDQWIERNPDLRHPLTEVTKTELNRISNLQTANEVVVVAVQSEPKEEPEFAGNLVLILDGIQDPGNMGTILRIADWFGVTQMICSNDCVEKYNPKVVQSSMGSITRVSCWYKNFDKWQLPAGIPVFGALLVGKSVYASKNVKEGVLVVGNESKGIREPLLSQITHPVTIPKLGGAESLNVAVATGIIIGCLTNSDC